MSSSVRLKSKICTKQYGYPKITDAVIMHVVLNVNAGIIQHEKFVGIFRCTSSRALGMTKSVNPVKKQGLHTDSKVQNVLKKTTFGSKSDRGRVKTLIYVDAHAKRLTGSMMMCS